MEISGKIIHKLDLRSGTSKAGNEWKSQEYVLETEDQFPKKVHFDFFGDRVDQFPLNIGDRVKVYFDIESREYNGRWYTSIRGWKTENLDAANAGAPVPPMGVPADAPAAAPFDANFTASENETDDLPF